MLTKVKKFVAKTFHRDLSGEGLTHFKRTVYWAKKINPKADEAVAIAAFAHDLERGLRKTTSEKRFKNIEFNNPRFLLAHQKKGAQYLSNFLKKQKYSEEKIKRIYNMVLKHEVGGDRESNLIKDADSISYLENNATKHITNLTGKLGSEKIKRKIDWMYDRISSKKAKQLARPFYKKVLKSLK